MGEKIIFGPDGLPDDALRHRPMSAAEEARFDQAQTELARLRVPQLLQAGKP